MSTPPFNLVVFVALCAIAFVLGIVVLAQTVLNHSADPQVVQALIALVLIIQSYAHLERTIPQIQNGKSNGTNGH